MRVVMDSAGPRGAVGNLNYLRLFVPASGPTPFGGTPARVPGTIEAENFDEGGEGVGYHDATGGNSGGQYRTTDVDLESTSDSGGGYNVGWIDSGEWLNYAVNVTAAGPYLLEARVASNGSGGTFHLEVSGVDITGPLAIPDTGGWQIWTTLSTSVTLAAGEQTLRIVFDTSLPGRAVGNINYLRLSSTAQQ
jgi:hypothetical protein